MRHVPQINLRAETKNALTRIGHVMVTMTVVTSPMKTIVPLEVLLVKVQRNCVTMVASVSIPAGFVTVKLIVMMVLMRKAATVSTSCLFIVVVCYSSSMINH